MILVLSTTNRPQSLTEIIGNYYYNYLIDKNIDAQHMSLTNLPHNFTYTALYHNKGKNKIFNQMTTQLQQAQKFVFIIPEYNASFPGVFKAFIDGTERHFFKNKKCALVGVSKGHQGAILALSHLSDIFHYLGMIIHPTKLKLSRIADPSLDEVKKHPHYLTKLQEQADAFIRF